MKGKKSFRLLLLLVLFGIIWNYLHPTYHIIRQHRSECYNLSELTIDVSIPKDYSEQRLALLKDSILCKQKEINYDLHTDIYHIRFYYPTHPPLHCENTLFVIDGKLQKLKKINFFNFFC